MNKYRKGYYNVITTVHSYREAKHSFTRFPYTLRLLSELSPCQEKSLDFFIKKGMPYYYKELSDHQQEISNFTLVTEDYYKSYSIPITVTFDAPESDIKNKRQIREYMILVNELLLKTP